VAGAVQRQARHRLLLARRLRVRWRRRSAKRLRWGYSWSSEVAGYSVRYAVRLAAQDGGERIILITDRRLSMADGAEAKV